MKKRGSSPRLMDMIEAIERIGGILSGVSLDAFEQDWEKRWLVERVLKLFRRQVAI